MTLLPCLVHNTHNPRPHINEKHHIHPLGYHGPNTASNIVVVCATGHNTIHELLEMMLRAGTIQVPHRTYTRGEYEYAVQGFNQIMAYAESLVQQ